MQALDAGSEEVFTFPMLHDFKAMGPADLKFLETVVATVAALAPVEHQSVSHKASGKARWWSVTVPAHIESRAQLVAVYAALKALPEVKWTL